MKIEDLKNRLYRKSDQELAKRKRAGDYYDPEQARQVEDRFGKIEDVIIEKQEEGWLSAEARKKRNRKIILSGAILLGSILAVVILVAGYFNFSQKAFQEERIQIAMEGPKEVASLERADYQLKIVNNNRVSLLNANVVVVFPDELKIKATEDIKVEGPHKVRVDLGTIGKKEEKLIDFQFETLSEEDKNLYFDVILEYRPSNFNSLFIKKHQEDFFIKASPLKIDILPIEEAASGERVEIEVVLRNQSEETFQDLSLRLQYPEGFSLIESDPAVSQAGNVWKIAKLEGQSQWEMKLAGSVHGYFNTTKVFQAEVYQQKSEEEKILSQSRGVVEIVPQRVEIIQEVTEEDFYPASVIGYRVKFKNTSTVPLRDLILELQLTSQVINEQEVEVEKGFYDSQKNALIWKAADIPKLKVLQPKEEGEVLFSLEVMEELPHRSIQDRNFTILSQASIHSLDVDSPIGQNKRIKSAIKELRINSGLTLMIDGYYAEGSLENSGPTVLTVEKETTLGMKLRIKNTANDLEGMTLVTGLPSGIVWTGETLFGDEMVEFNERTGELRWDLQTVKAGAGYYEKERVIEFQIKVKPSENQLGEKIVLLNEFFIKGKDGFTNRTVEYPFENFLSERVGELGSSGEVVSQ